jgi:hypothetical protein
MRGGGADADSPLRLSVRVTARGTRRVGSSSGWAVEEDVDPVGSDENGRVEGVGPSHNDLEASQRSGRVVGGSRSGGVVGSSGRSGGGG